MQVLRGVAISSIILSAIVILSSLSVQFVNTNIGSSNSVSNGNVLPGYKISTSITTQDPPSPSMLKILHTIPFGFGGPIEPTVDKWNDHVYVPMNEQNRVTVINGSNDVIIANASVPNPPIGAAFDSWNGNIYVAQNGTISVLNATTNRVVGNISGAINPVYIAFDVDNGYLYETTSNTAGSSGYLTVINAKTGLIIGITTLQDPWGMAIDSLNGRIYVADQGLQGVYVINDKTQLITGEIQLYEDATGAVFDPTNNNIYIAGGNQVVGISGATDSIIAVFSTPSSTFKIAYDSINNDLYATESYSGKLAVLNSNNGSIVRQISISSGQPTDIAYDSSDNVVFVCSPEYTITVINGTANEIKTILGTAGHPDQIGFDRSNGQLYVTETISNNVAVVNGSTSRYTGNFYEDGQPAMIVADTSNNTLYISDVYSNQISVVHPPDYSSVKEMGVGTSPEGVVYDNLNHCVYVMNMNSGSITVLNTMNSSDIKSISVGGNSNPNEAPYMGALDTMNHNLYITNFFHDSVTVISTKTNKEVANINIGNQTSGIAYDSWNGYLYVTSPDSNRVAVINVSSNSVTDYINVGNSPSAIAFDSFNGYVFVANSGSGNVSVINGATESVVTVIPVGENPEGMAFDTLNGYIYVSNHDSNSISVIGYPSYRVSFTESGLQTGNWYVNITGSEVTSSGPISGTLYHFMLPAGKYHYDFSTDNTRYAPVNSSENFSISASPVSESLNFTKINAPANNQMIIYAVSGGVFLTTAVVGTLYFLRKRRN